MAQVGVLCSTAIGFVLCRIDIGQHAARNFYEAICSAAEGIDVDIAMVGGASRHILINAQNYHAWPYLMLNSPFYSLKPLTACHDGSQAFVTSSCISAELSIEKAMPSGELLSQSSCQS